MRIRPGSAATAITTTILLAATAFGAEPPVSAAPPGALGGVGLTGQWITDQSGRVVIVHGLNQVYKAAPYEPSAGGFDTDDAQFLADNGFNAVRVGVIWAAVEPRPGTYDDAYLDSVAQTVDTLAQHGVRSLLDFHQDLYNEVFQGEGAPAWAVQSGGLPNPALGFPGNYLGNPAEQHAWDQFWRNAPGPDGVGLQDHFAAAWAHVAQRFGRASGVMGYELLNEPWPGTLWEPCALPGLGCPGFDAALTAFYQRVDDRIRRADPVTPVWFEPNVLLDQSFATRLGTVRDPRSGFAFHDYCATEDATGSYALCPPQDDAIFAGAEQYASAQHKPELMTEFGATNDLTDLQAMVDRADRNRVGWLEWAYTGNDKTSTAPTAQALVYDPSKPPTGTNVNSAKLAALAEAYPQLVAGTPLSWSSQGSTCTLSYTTARADGAGQFAAGSETDVATPAVRYPHGYTVQLAGAEVVSAPGATTTRLRSLPGADTITVTITANP